MIINTFSVDGLFDLIDAELTFRPDLNVLVGRNGAGKTSVLALLSSLIRLDFEAIKAMPFKSAKLEILDDQSESIVIEATNTQNDSFISIARAPYGQVRVPLIDLDYLYRQSVRRMASKESLSSSRIDSTQNQQDVIQQWFAVSSEFQRHARLTFVRLDRTILAMDPDGVESIDMPSPAIRDRARPAPKRDPIDEVIRVTHAKYIDFRNQVDAIRANTYKDMTRLHFAPIKHLGRKANILALRKKLTQLKIRVGGSALAADMQTITDEFFESLEVLLKQTENQAQLKRSGRKSLAEESIQLLLELKERQTESLLNIFDAEQQKLEAAGAPIKKYIDTLSRFLSESGKSLKFDEESFQLGFWIPAARAEAAGTVRALKDLSSGERQILIVLTYLAFMSGSKSIFIIDEPELSLHLRWQSYLVDALRDLRPEGGQIIIATHAPEIAGRARENSIQLTQKYLPVLRKTRHE